MITSRNALRKKLEEGRRRNAEMAAAGIEVDLYKRPLVRYVITVYSDGSIKADKVTLGEENKKEEKNGEDST